ncbi:MAG: hypothetical protein VKJ04_00925 [Vampirovibrionales bacterium]|nr:hypothetical protein [Vampirovibrionales bacterium]
MVNRSFIKLADVDLAQPETWQGKQVLTFDIDWASDDVLTYTIDLLAEASLPATFFVTHDTPVLERIRQNPQWELGIHPNFNPLFSGEAGSVSEILAKIKMVVPEAVSLRSHSLTTSGRWLEFYRQYGIKFVSNVYMPGQDGIRPYAHINGLIECPEFFADDGYLYMIDQAKRAGIEPAVLCHPDFVGLRVYDFHPIHIALNSESLSRYEETRSFHQDWKQLHQARFSGFGIENLFRKLLT